MKLVALGTTSFLENCVKGLLTSGCTIQALISMPAEHLPDNSSDIRKFALEIGSGYYESKDINSEETVRYIKGLKPDVIFSAWPKIISEKVINIPAIGVIGSHPTALPLNRGRHPFQWQIVLGIQQSKLSFFMMDAGIDSGDLVLQIPYKIDLNDTIVTLSGKVNTLAFEAAKKIGKELVTTKALKAVKQDTSLINTWRKRNRYDVLIDFRMNANNILALVRSFTLPYPCATFIFEDSVLHVISGVIDRSYNPDIVINMEPGKIISADEHSIKIKAADFVLVLQTQENISQIIGSKKHIFPPGKYLLKYPKSFANLF
jgi:methionyl-tRNA formyltransferase